MASILTGERGRSSATSTSPSGRRSETGSRRSAAVTEGTRMWGRLTAGLTVAILVSVALAPGLGDAQQNAQARIGVVDVQRVLARSAAGVAAREQLEREKAAMQKEVDTKRQE